ncbi:hypothetical protein SAMN04515665_101352 [Blastococcus sp. DSM 46786]|uniref:hypothetical protein n=1 Tax=Blastococcus sp. DSM 46786 TaxID=1798227 RepID=UPI0008D0F02E|nr:hypothetical protein [Blastococcus sp. DSM 46786]SEK30347.1 hypothetical protein SAMN04515665_101352 [Blastococcus sp. DSM 46786]
MSPLEERYRRLLRLLPEPARSRWADDMVGTYLAATTRDDPEYAEFGSPTPADRLDVLRLALRLHLGAPGATIRAVAAGRTVRLVALTGSVALATQGLVGLAMAAWVHGLVPGVPAPQLPGPLLLRPEAALGHVVDVLLVALAVCLVRGASTARPLAVAALLGLVLATSLRLGGPTTLPAVLSLVTWAVPLLAAVLVPAEPAPRRARWQVVVPALVTLLGPVVATAGWAASRPEREPGAWLLALGQPVGWWVVALVAAGAAVLSRPSATAVGRLGVAALGVALLPSLAGQLTYGGVAGYRAVVVTGLVLLAGTVLVTGASGVRHVRALPAGATGDRSR